MVNIKKQTVTTQESITSQNAPPWPEWDDSVINSMTWGHPAPTVSPKRGATPKPVGTSKKPATPKRATARKGVPEVQLQGEQPEKESSIVPFQEGPIHGVLPRSIPVDKWMRPSEVQPEAVFTLDPEPVPLDLLSNNEHLLQFKVMRWIISSVMCLERCGALKPFPVEYTSPLFTPNTDENWKPWNHVYSLTKAGRGQQHKPLYNQFGMYVIRLFYMGKWRRIVVDDYLPYDEFGRLLLPVSQTENNLWLPLLCKGLLRIASLSWDDMNDVKDFNVITCLTGWIQYSADFRGVDLNEAWDICCSHLMPKTELEEEPPDQLHCSQRPDGFCINDIMPHYCDLSESRYLFAVLPELMDWNELPGIAPNLEHVIFLEKLIRDKVTMDDLPAWKEFRWLDWAYRNNIITAKPGTVFKKVSAYCPFSKTVVDPRGLSDISDTMLDYIKEKKEDEVIEAYDFEMLIKKIRSIELYFLPSFFQHSVTTESIPHLLEPSLPKYKSEIGSHKKDKTVENRSASKGNMSSNETFYLFTDTPFCKKFFITLSVLNDENIKPQGYLMCENYHWKLDMQGPTLTSLRTSGCNTKIISFGPGKHICRIWYNLPQKYFLQINSQSPFTIGNKELIHQLSQEESMSYNLFGEQMSRLFNELVSKEHGTKEQGMALVNFISSFYPYHLRLKSMLYEQLVYSIPFDKLFEESLMELLLSKDYSQEKTVATVNLLRQLFLNPKFGEDVICQLKPDLLELLNNEQTIINPQEVEEEVSKPSKKEPSGKKKASTANLKQKRKEVSAKTPSYDLLLDSPENNIALLRKIVTKEAKLMDSYPFCFDDEMKLLFSDHKGVSTVVSNHNFTVFTRFIVNVHSREPVPCGVHLFMTAESGTPSILVYNIDNYDTVPLNYDSNCTYYLKNNYYGYAILILFYQTEPVKSKRALKQEISWRLRVLGCNAENVPHFCMLSEDKRNCPAKMVPCPAITRQTINGYYLPSSQNIITKFIINTTYPEVVTLQLTVSHSSASVKIIIYDQEEQVMFEMTGLGKLLVPALLLTPREPGDEEGLPFFTGIILLAKEDSWPLTNEETKAVNLIRETYNPYVNIPENGLQQSAVSVYSRKAASSKFSNKSIYLEKPTWYLTMYHSKLQPTDISITHDNRDYLKMKSLLLEKEKVDPGRAKRGKELRETYLAEIGAAMEASLKQPEEESVVPSEELNQSLSTVPSTVSVEPILFSELLEKYSLPVEEDKLLMLKYFPYKENSLLSSQLDLYEYEDEESIVGTPELNNELLTVMSMGKIMEKKMFDSRIILKRIKHVMAEGNELKDDVLYLREKYISEALKRQEELKKKEEEELKKKLETLDTLPTKERKTKKKKK